MDIEAVKEEIKAKVEKYHQDHWSALYPAGIGLREWAVQAVAENVVMPLLEENERLKKQVAEFQNSMINKQPA
jgi:hypothetical protein